MQHLWLDEKFLLMCCTMPTQYLNENSARRLPMLKCFEDTSWSHMCMCHTLLVHSCGQWAHNGSHYMYSTSVNTPLHIRGTWFLGHKRLDANSQKNVYGFSEQELHAQTLLHISLKWSNKAHTVLWRRNTCVPLQPSIKHPSHHCKVFLIKLRTELHIYTQILERDWCPWEVATII